MAAYRPPARCDRGRSRARRLRGQEHFRAAAAAEGGRRHAGPAAVTRYLEATGNTAPVNSRRSGRARAGLPAGRSTTRTARRQEGHAAVHHRAGALQAQARAGAGRGGRRAGDAQAGRGRLQAAGRSGAAPGRRRRPPSITRPSTRDNAQANLQQAQANTKHRRRSIYGYTKVTRAVRRHRDGASGLGRRTGRRRRRRPARHHRRSSIRST